MSIITRNDRKGYWVRRKINGRWIQRYAGKTKREARELETYLLKALAPRPANDLNQFVEEVFWPAQLNHLSGKSAARERGILNNHVGPYFTGPMDHITPQKIIQYISQRRADRVSPDTIRKELMTLRHILRKAIRLDLLDKDPFAKLDRTDIPKPAPERIRYLTVEEWEQLLFHIPEQHVIILLFMVNTGCRRGETLELEHQDLDLEAGLARVRKDKRGKPKVVPLAPFLVEMLRRHPHREGTPRVFWHVKYGESLTKAFQKACKKAGIQGCRLHDLRHSFASQLAMHGVDIRTIQELLGHQDPKMAARYTHLSPAHLEKSILAIEGIYKNKIN